jgi:predicted O-linked N-acetylglucosamine transferase (SPINDLY family)
MVSGYAPRTSSAVASAQALLDAARSRLETGDIAGAESLYRGLLEQQPEHVEASTALSALLDDLGRRDEAEAVFRRLVEGAAPTASAYCNLGVMLFKQGRAAEALDALQRAVSMQSNYAIALDNLGATLATLERYDEAEHSIRAALAIDERSPSAHNNLGTLLMRRHDDSALACFDRALAIDPTFFDAHVQRATLLREQGSTADAVMAWRRAMTLAPAMMPVWSNLLLTLLYVDDVPAGEVLVWHRRFNTALGLISAGGAPMIEPQGRAPEPTSRLRVGFLSPDLRRHPVGIFIEQLLEHHDRSRIEVVCYHDSVVDDEVSARLAARAVPGSRLLLKAAALTYRSVRERLLAEFSARGVDADRIAFREWQTQGHLGAYDEVDIAVDTWPFNGATTTCEALWMGVPLVTVAGDRPQARMGVSILTAAGCAEWIASDAAGFVSIAQCLASDLGALQGIRCGLRAKLSASPLLDGKGFARDFEKVLRTTAIHRVPVPGDRVR